MSDALIESAIEVDAAGDTHIGQRQYNEDSILLRPDLHLYLLADGAGGHNAGNVASALATTAVVHHFEDTEVLASVLPEYDSLGLATAARRLATAVQQANREVIGVARTSDRHRGMGTTIVAVFVVPEQGMLHVAYVGDSRCYRLRAGRLELLTHDHTLLNDVLELRPDLPDSETAKLPRNVITRALGMSDSVRVSVRSHDIVPGDRYLLCSDGLTDVLGDEAIASAMGSDGDAEARVRHIMAMALDAGADDNVAAVMLTTDFAPGRTTMPERRSVRPRPLRRPATPGGTGSSAPLEDDDYPEIIIMDEDVHVVPARSATAEVRNVVRNMMTKPSSPPPNADDDDS